MGVDVVCCGLAGVEKTRCAPAVAEGNAVVVGMLRRVHERGYRALAVPGAERLDPGARRLADRLGLTVLAVDRPLELAQTCWRLAVARDALVLDLVRRLTAAFRYPARDLADLLAHLAAATGSGVALLDASGVVEEHGGELSGWLAERTEVNGLIAASLGTAPEEPMAMLQEETK